MSATKHFYMTLESLEPAIPDHELDRFPVFEHPEVTRREQALHDLPEQETRAAIDLIMNDWHGSFAELLSVAAGLCTAPAAP